MQVRLENESDAVVTVSAASFSSSALTSEASWEPRRTLTLEPGRSVDLPVLLPPARCTGEDPTPHLTASIEAGTSSYEVSAAIPDELEVMTRLAAVACDQDAIASIASIQATALGPPAGLGDPILLEVAVTPTGDAGQLRLVGLRGTPLLRFTGGEEWRIDLSVEARDETSTFVAELEPRRCDPHAIAEDKVGARITLVVEVDAREAVVPLAGMAALSAELLSRTAAACGLI